MNTHLLNRAILNRDALDDNQRKAELTRIEGIIARDCKA